MEKRVISTQLQEEDIKIETNLRPQTLDEYIGQEKTKEKLNKMLAENTGKDLEQIMADTERDNWLSAEEAAEYGLIDKIVTKREKDVKDKE